MVKKLWSLRWIKEKVHLSIKIGFIKREIREVDEDNLSNKSIKFRYICFRLNGIFLHRRE